MKKGFAEYFILRDEDGNSTGYSVRLFETGNPDPIEEYNAGDCHFDSQVFGTGQINEGQLLEFAKETAQGMLLEHKLEGEASEIEE